MNETTFIKETLRAMGVRYDSLGIREITKKNRTPVTVVRAKKKGHPSRRFVLIRRNMEPWLLIPITTSERKKIGRFGFLPPSVLDRLVPSEWVRS